MTISYKKESTEDYVIRETEEFIFRLLKMTVNSINIKQMLLDNDKLKNDLILCFKEELEDLLTNELYK